MTMTRTTETSFPLTSPRRGRGRPCRHGALPSSRAPRFAKADELRILTWEGYAELDWPAGLCNT